MVKPNYRCRTSPRPVLNWWIQKSFLSPGCGQPSRFPAACWREGKSAPRCLLPAPGSVGNNIETEQRAAMCSRQDLGRAVRRPGSSLQTSVLSLEPAWMCQLHLPGNRDTCIPQGVGKILGKQEGEARLKQLSAQGDLMVLQFHVLTFLN